MVERTLPGLGISGFDDKFADDWHVWMDENLRMLSFKTGGWVQSRSTDPLPSPPAAGETVYIVDSGDATNPNKVAVWDGPSGSEAWVYYDPQDGWEFFVRDSNERVRYDGSAWVVIDPQLVFNNQTGTSYTLTLTDIRKVVRMNNASANTVTIPTNASVPFPIGAYLWVEMTGTGTTTVAGDVGVTVNTPDNLDLVRYQQMRLMKVDTDEWVASDDIAGTGGSDTSAIHDNVAGEIAAITEKTTLAGADVFVVEDSADANNKKRVSHTNVVKGLSALSQETSISTVSGTVKDFTGLPTGRKRVIVPLYGVSLAGAAGILVQIGDPTGGLKTSGYLNAVGNVINNSGTDAGSSSGSGFYIHITGGGAVIYGELVITRVGSGHKWVAHLLGAHSTTTVNLSGGGVELSDELDRVRVTVTASNFDDAGVGAEVGCLHMG